MRWLTALKASARRRGAELAFLLTIFVILFLGLTAYFYRVTDLERRYIAWLMAEAFLINIVALIDLANELGHRIVRSLELYHRTVRYWQAKHARLEAQTIRGAEQYDALQQEYDQTLADKEEFRERVRILENGDEHKRLHMVIMNQQAKILYYEQKERERFIVPPGQALVEYSVVIAAVALVVIGVLAMFGGEVYRFFETVVTGWPL